MKDNKVFLTILAVIAVILGVLLVYYFTSVASGGGGFSIGGSSSNNGGGFTTGGSSGGSSSSGSSGSSGGVINNVDKDEKIAFGEVKDYNEFFNVINIINYYYEAVVNDNYADVLNMFDKTYVTNNNIKVTNVKKYVETGYQNLTYYGKKMYRKGMNGVRYYFVSGDLQKYDMAEEIMTEASDMNFLVIIDYNNEAFSITPLVSTSKIFDYAQDYELVSSKKITQNESNEYSENSYSDEIITITYISYFKNMLFLNTEKAYNMLADSYKQNFPELEDFTNSLDTLYSTITTNITSYGSSGSDGKRKFVAVMSNGLEIEFQENSIMDFKVTVKD